MATIKSDDSKELRILIMKIVCYYGGYIGGLTPQGENEKKTNTEKGHTTLCPINYFPV